MKYLYLVLTMSFVLAFLAAIKADEAADDLSKLMCSVYDATQDGKVTWNHITDTINFNWGDITVDSKSTTFYIPEVGPMIMLHSEANCGNKLFNLLLTKSQSARIINVSIFVRHIESLLGGGERK